MIRYEPGDSQLDEIRERIEERYCEARAWLGREPIPREVRNALVAAKDFEASHVSTADLVDETVASLNEVFEAKR